MKIEVGHRRQPSRAPKILASQSSGARSVGSMAVCQVYFPTTKASLSITIFLRIYSHISFSVSSIRSPATPCKGLKSEAMAPPENPPSISPSTRSHRQTALSTTSQTQIETNAAPHPRLDIPVGTLRLRATAAPNDTRVRWAEDVIDNEGLGRKRSKGSSSKMPQLAVRRTGRNAMATTAGPGDGHAIADVVMRKFAASTTRPMKWANRRPTPLQTRRRRIRIQKAVEVMKGGRGWEVRERGRRNAMSMTGKGDVGNMGIRGREGGGMRMRASPRRRVAAVRSRSHDN